MRNPLSTRISDTLLVVPLSASGTIVTGDPSLDTGVRYKLIAAIRRISNNCAQDMDTIEANLVSILRLAQGYLYGTGAHLAGKDMIIPGATLRFVRPPAQTSTTEVPIACSANLL
jgi:hypothetical protein